MVEVEDSGKGLGGEDKLRERVTLLARELDELETLHKKAGEAFRGAFAAVAGISSPDIPAQAQNLLKKLKKEVGKRPEDPADLEKAVSAFKTSLMTPRQKAGRDLEVLGEKEGDEEQGGAAAGTWPWPCSPACIWATLILTRAWKRELPR